jgi:hypothetical protein
MTGLLTGRKPPISHLRKTWKRAAVMREMRTPIVAVEKDWNDLLRIWKTAKQRTGTRAASKAAA